MMIHMHSLRRAAVARKASRKHHNGYASDKAVGCMLGVTDRTIRAWKKRLATKSAEVRSSLGVERKGKQLRLRLPKGPRELESWLLRLKEVSGSRGGPHLSSAAEALASDWPFEARHRRGMNKITREFMRQAGLDGVDRTREIGMLRLAMQLKRGTWPQSPSSESEEQQTLDSYEWEKKVEDYTAMAEWVACNSHCSVKDVPRHWPLYLRRRNEDIRAGRLVDAVVDTAALTGHHRGPGEITRKEPQPMTGAEIQRECDLLAEVWPAEEHWQKAETEARTLWQTETLTRAARDLVQEGKRITAENLAPLLFLNRRTQDHWEKHQRHLRLEQEGIRVFCAEALCGRGKRGISPREFCHRYSRSDIKAAKAAALAAR
jgi:hypothetical protein